MDQTAGLVILLKFPRRHEGAATQLARLWGQLDLTGAPGEHPYFFRSWGDGPPPENEEDVDGVALIDHNPKPLEDWLATQGAEDLHHPDIVSVIAPGPNTTGSFGARTSCHFEFDGGSVLFRDDEQTVNWPDQWRQLLLAMVELWDAEIAVVSRDDEFFDLPRRDPDQMAGLLSYVRADVTIDPAIATTEKILGGTLITTVDTEPDTIKAVRAQIAAQLHPQPASSSAPRTAEPRDPADDYTSYITGIHPEPDGTRLQLHVGDVAFPGYVNRAGADVYLRAIYLADLHELADITPDEFAESWRRQAEADHRAVTAVRPNGIIEYHCNDQVLATLLRGLLADTGVHVFHTPIKDDQ